MEHYPSCNWTIRHVWGSHHDDHWRHLEQTREEEPAEGARWRVDVCPSAPAALATGAGVPRHRHDPVPDAGGPAPLPRVPEVLPFPGLRVAGRRLEERDVNARGKRQAAGEPDGRRKARLAHRPQAVPLQGHLPAGRSLASGLEVAQSTSRSVTHTMTQRARNKRCDTSSQFSVYDSFVLRLALIWSRSGAGYVTFVTHTKTQWERNKWHDTSSEFSMHDLFVSRLPLIFMCCKAKPCKRQRIVANILLCGVYQTYGLALRIVFFSRRSFAVTNLALKSAILLPIG